MSERDRTAYRVARIIDGMASGDRIDAGKMSDRMGIHYSNLRYYLLKYEGAGKLIRKTKGRSVAWVKP